MNITTIFVNNEDAENLAVILIRAEKNFYVEKCLSVDGNGFLFTISGDEVDEE